MAGFALTPCMANDLENPEIVEHLLSFKGERIEGAAFRARVPGDRAFTEVLGVANSRGGYDVRLARGANPPLFLENCAAGNWSETVGSILSQARAKPGDADRVFGRDVPTVRAAMSVAAPSLETIVAAVVEALRSVKINVAAPNVTVLAPPAPQVTVNVTPEVSAVLSSEPRTVAIERDGRGLITGATVG